MTEDLEDGRQAKKKCAEVFEILVVGLIVVVEEKEEEYAKKS
jgi:hypothetical protein